MTNDKKSSRIFDGLFPIKNRYYKNFLRNMDDVERDLNHALDKKTLDELLSEWATYVECDLNLYLPYVNNAESLLSEARKRLSLVELLHTAKQRLNMLEGQKNE